MLNCRLDADIPRLVNDEMDFNNRKWCTKSTYNLHIGPSNLTGMQIAIAKHIPCEGG